VPPGATVAATDKLFPLVANDRHAYVFVPTGTTGILPGFSPANPPTFVLLSSETRLNAPLWLRLMLYDPTHYAVWGVAWDTPQGVAMLFGPPDPARVPLLVGTPPAFPQVFDAANLTLGPEGERIPALAPPGAVWIRTLPNLVGFAWFGPYATAPAGHYVAALRVAILPTGPNRTLAPSAPVLAVSFAAFGNWSTSGSVLTYARAGSGNWTWAEVPLYLPHPVFNLQVLGHGILYSGAYAELSEIAILAPGSPPPPAPL
jgi:hypothetical protein